MFELSRSLVLGAQSRWPHAAQAVIAVFEQEGFELLGDPGVEPLSFVRGTWLSTVMAIGPHKWKVRASLVQDVLDDTPRLVLTLHVYTHGQIVTHSERAYFIALLKQLQRSVHVATHPMSSQQAMILYGPEDFALAKRRIARQSALGLVLLMGAVPASAIAMLLLFGSASAWPPLLAMAACICVWIMFTTSKKSR